ncbi:MAG: diguanylate cyclase (GGDEF)-like protein/PAS domain S-box-containing protein [Enterobacterales bacterium]|jgi:diguanylate cyclase (GGDEF)-like protein/PAS domain S-box-containing protein
MKKQVTLFYALTILVALTFSAIAFLYETPTSQSFYFYIALALCIILLFLLFSIQRRHFKNVITKISGTIEKDWLQGLFINFPMGMLIVNSEGHILTANSHCCDFFKLNINKIKTASVESLINSQASQFFKDSITKKTKISLWRDEFKINADNNYQWLAMSICTIPLTAHVNGIWSITIEDVTAKRILKDKLDLIRSEQTLILDHTTIGLALVIDKQIVRANNALGRLLERYSSAMINQPLNKVIDPRDSSIDINENIVQELKINDDYQSEYLLYREDGSSFWCRIKATAASTEKMNRGFILSFEEATKQKQRDDGLRQAAVVFEASSDSIMVLDADGLIKIVNSAFNKMTGFSEADILGKSPRLLRATREDERRYDAMWSTVIKFGEWRGELWRRKKSGETYPEWASITAVKDNLDNVLEYVFIGSDMSERKYAEDRILYQANYDQLTNLPNRNLFMDRLHQSLQRVQREGTMLALLFIDLDRFKNINDSLGHSAGDKLLVEISKIMKETVRDSDTIARFGGDEFAVILSPIYGPKNASRVASALLESLRTPINIDGYEAIIGASIGISMYPADGTIEEELVKNADTAMYRAKESGRNNYQFFTEEMQQAAKDRLVMEIDLRQAIERQELRIVFQPQIDVSTGAISGAEVLVRWQSRDKGMISPAEFIYLAEDTGLIVPIGEWVLKQACLQHKRWKNAGVAPPYLAVNVSGRQFKMDGFSQSVLNTVQSAGLSTDDVELELTESFLMDDQEFSINTLKELKEMGFKLSIDDFGTGYSSLSYLKKFPIDRLKIDRSFVQDLEHNEEDYAIVRAIIDLAHTLNIVVIAEGVEEEGQRKVLEELKCDIIQGYFYSKPLDGAAFTLYLQQQRQQQE